MLGSPIPLDCRLSTVDMLPLNISMSPWRLTQAAVLTARGALQLEYPGDMVSALPLESEVLYLLGLTFHFPRCCRRSCCACDVYGSLIGRCLWAASTPSREGTWLERLSLCSRT